MIEAHDDVGDGHANAAIEADTPLGGLDTEGSSNDINTQEKTSEAFGGPDAKSAAQEDQPIEEVSDRNRVAQGEKTPEPANDVSPVQDRTAPLTDKEWSEHVSEVRDSLDEARDAGLESHLLYTIDPNHQAWTKDRRSLHDSIINDLYAAARDVPNQGHAVIAGGLGGSGKTTVLNSHADIDLNNYLVINPDNFKKEMAQRGMIPEIEGLSPMESSDLVHEESSYLARQMALRAQADGKNIIWDITMSTRESTEKRISDLRTGGYSRIDGLFIDIPIETSIKRTEARHREGHEQYRVGEGLGGRYLPPEVVERQEDPQWGSKNRKIFDAVKQAFNNWSIYDNSVDGRRAILRESHTERN
jgi:predicted ABC-type ATPase